MMGNMLEFAGNGNTYEGYIATPTSGSGPGVLVIQEWWGLVEHIKDVCDRFAAEGFCALAPDFYNGKKTTSPDEAGKLFMALNIAEAEKILRGAIQRLLSDPACSSSKVGTVGFCMGGQLSLYAAAANPDQVGACVDFYGIHPNVHPALENLNAPVLGIFAANDSSIPRAKVNQLSAKLTELGKQHDFHIYKGSNHAFFNNTSSNYNAEAASDARQRTLDFLRKNLLSERNAND